MEFKEEEVVTKKSTIDVQSGEVHKVIEKDNTVSVVFQEEKNDVLIKCVLNSIYGYDSSSIVVV